MLKGRLLCWLAVVAMVGCSPKVMTRIAVPRPALDPETSVSVLSVEDPSPTGAEFVGEVEVGETGFTSTRNGTFEKVLGLAVDKTREAGGNVLKLTQHRAPDLVSSVHRIKGDILWTGDSQSSVGADSIKLSDHPDYAVLHLYRGRGLGGAVVYDVHLGDSTVFHSRPGTGTQLCIPEGEYLLWASTESREELPLSVRAGEDYYIRCSTTFGVMAGRPLLEIMPGTSGVAEFRALEADQAIVTGEAATRHNPSWRIGVHVGGAWRTGSAKSGMDEAMDSYIRRLKWGFTIGVDAIWFAWEGIGFGVRVTDMHSWNGEDATISYQHGTQATGRMEDHIDIWFVGPVLAARLRSRDLKHSFMMDYGLGYMGYHNKGKMITPISLNGGTLGYMIGLGYDYSLTEHLQLGVAFSMQSGTLRHANFRDGNASPKRIDYSDEQAVGLGYLALSAGVRWLF